jgi:outer membrane biogenesis lipoprotein LolB
MLRLSMLGMLAIFLLSACVSAPDKPAVNEQDLPIVTVYKSPT